MSDFRKKAKEIKAAGDAERGNFTPTGVPKRIYLWWLVNSNSRKASLIRTGSRKENFCHFWRVVVIWAGLLRVRLGVANFFEKYLDNRYAAIAVGLAVLGVFTWALVTTGNLLDFVTVLGAVVGIVAVVAALVVGGALLVDRFWRSEWNDLASKIAFWTFCSIAVGVVIFAITLLTINIGCIFLAVLVGCLAGGAVVVYGISKWVDYLSGKRALAIKARRKAEDEAWEKYIRGEGPIRTPREPNGIEKFFSGVVDFLILITQIVRVKKWKICPFVEVD